MLSAISGKGLNIKFGGVSSFFKMAVGAISDLALSLFPVIEINILC